ncbi:dihydrofolate reductase [Myotisia sp. PD_48]|nr:dihydrofolate reductase [Myotisia sp. PD_48]
MSPSGTADPPASHTSPTESTMPKLPAITLIVATTPITCTASHLTPGACKLGIGFGGTLPWPRIKSDMGFFARVTTRPPASREQLTSTGPPAINAVIMGRKTYDSLPTRFRPLPKRLNVVITRDESGAVEQRVIADWYAAKMREFETGKQQDAEQDPQRGEGWEKKPDVMVSSSLEKALGMLSTLEAAGRKVGNIFIIGGSEIYSSALQLKSNIFGDNVENKLRIVMTDVRRRTSDSQSQTDPSEWVDGFDCDTFFPVNELKMSQEWKQVGAEEVTEWVGEAVTPDWIFEGDIAVRMVGYEKT